MATALHQVHREHLIHFSELLMGGVLKISKQMKAIMKPMQGPSRYLGKIQFLGNLILALMLEHGKKVWPWTSLPAFYQAATLALSSLCLIFHAALLQYFSICSNKLVAKILSNGAGKTPVYNYVIFLCMIIRKGCEKSVRKMFAMLLEKSCTLRAD